MTVGINIRKPESQPASVSHWFHLKRYFTERKKNMSILSCTLSFLLDSYTVKGITYLRDRMETLVGDTLMYPTHNKNQPYQEQLPSSCYCSRTSPLIRVNVRSYNTDIVNQKSNVTLGYELAYCYNTTILTELSQYQTRRVFAFK